MKKDSLTKNILRQNSTPLTSIRQKQNFLLNHLGPLTTTPAPKNPANPHPTTLGHTIAQLNQIQDPNPQQQRVIQLYNRAQAKALKVYTTEEQMQAWIAPMILNLMATQYATMAADISADCRIDHLKKPTRQMREHVKGFNSEFNFYISQIPGFTQLIDKMRRQLYNRTEGKMQQIMRWAENEVKRLRPQIQDPDHMDLTIFALCAQTVLVLVMQQWLEWGEKFKHDCGLDLTLHSPYTHMLFRDLEPYIDGIRIEQLRDITTILNILRNQVIQYCREDLSPDGMATIINQ